jgi:DNA-binding response OmpR family regulator
MNVSSAAGVRPRQAGCVPGTPCVLFVDDHADTRTALSRLLRREGYGVLTAGTVAEARLLLQSEPVDLLVADVQLPDGDGCDLLADARRSARPALRAIAVSGHGDDQRRRRCKDAGFDDYLLKPVPWEDLIAAVRRVG